MTLQEDHTKKITLGYLICFAMVSLWYIYHGLTLSQIAPVFFLAKPDITGHLLMATNIQHAIIQNSWLRLLFDCSFFILPFLLVFAFIKKLRILPFVAVVTVLLSFVYVYLFSMMSFVSIEPLMTWFLFPLLFSSNKLEPFYFKLHIFRILFILFFAGAGLWKLRNGGAFSQGQMSGILTAQFSTVLAAENSSSFYGLIKYLINHGLLSWLLYLLAIAAELFFLVGLFTKKYDRLLLFLLLGFIVFDYLLMRINYFSWLPFCMLFYYSKYQLPNNSYALK